MLHDENVIHKDTESQQQIFRQLRIVQRCHIEAYEIIWIEPWQQRKILFTS
jgi:hypothetical protein